MSTITQYILSRGVSEDVLILLFSIPAIMALILCIRQILGFATSGFLITTLLVFSISVFNLKYIGILFIIIFTTLIVSRHFLKKIKYLTRATGFIVDALSLCFLFVVLLLVFVCTSFFKLIPLTSLSLLIILIIAIYSKNSIVVFEAKKFKDFLNPTIKSLVSIIIISFLINWEFFRYFILRNPFVSIIIPVLVIILLASWRGLTLSEYILFKETIKHVELSEEK